MKHKKSLIILIVVLAIVLFAFVGHNIYRYPVMLRNLSDNSLNDSQTEELRNKIINQSDVNILVAYLKVYRHVFVVTNMDSSPKYLIKFYCKRGLMENFIKESKSGFDFASVSSHTRIVNANRLQVHALAVDSWYSYQFRYCSLNNSG